MTDPKGIIRPFEHSGETPVQGVLLLVLAAVVMGVAGPVIYTWITVYISLIPLGALTLFGVLVATGVLLGYVGRAGHLRNPKLVGRIGFISGLYGLYVSWVSYLYFFSTTRLGWSLLVYHPGEVWSAILSLAQIGPWSLYEIWTPGSTVLAILWSAEALAFLSIPPLLASSGISQTAYCEHCQEWLDGEPDQVLRESLNDNFRAGEALRNGDLSPVEELDEYREGDSRGTRLEFRRCPSCRESHTLTVIDFGPLEDDETPMGVRGTQVGPVLELTKRGWERLGEQSGVEFERSAY